MQQSQAIVVNFTELFIKDAPDLVTQNSTYNVMIGFAFPCSSYYRQAYFLLTDAKSYRVE